MSEYKAKYQKTNYYIKKILIFIVLLLIVQNKVFASEPSSTNYKIESYGRGGR